MPDLVKLRVLLRGGFGSGKSTVGRLLHNRGAVVIDADQIGHQVLEPGGEAFEAVSRQWPEAVEGGRIDRRRLGRIVFAERSRLALLESMTHPAIRERVGNRVEEAGASIVVVEVPLLKDLFGDGWISVVVDADVANRRRRLLDRGISEDEIGPRMAAQPLREEWTEAADYVIDNSGDMDGLEREVDALWEWLQEELERLSPR